MSMPKFNSQPQKPPGRRALTAVILVLPVVGLGACAGKPFGEDTRERMDTVLEDSLRGIDRAPPREVTDALLAEEGLAWVEAEREERFDVQVRNVDAETFFMGLVQDTPHNMVVHPEVRGRISVNLRNVTIPEVMEAISEVYGYEYRELAGGWLVLPAGLHTRVFQVDYLTMSREGSSSMRVASGQIGEGDAGRRGTTGRGFGAQPTFRPGERETRATGSRIETEMKSDFWAELESTLRAMVGGAEGRRVIVNPHSSTIAVRAMPNELREIERFLGEVQGNIARQVILEAKILEVELRDEFRSGINWSGLQESGRDSARFGMRSGPDMFEDGFAPGRGRPIGMDHFEGAQIGGTFAAALQLGSDFSAFIELLQRQGETRVLSSPRVSTVNNQKAVIKVGSDEFFVTGVMTGGAFGIGATTAQRNVELTPFFSGIALDVTPQISREGDVVLHIHPTVSQVRDQRKDLTIAGETDSLPLAFSEVRESDSIVRARSGQIVVIGGLMQTQMSDEVFSTPVLGNIPVIGNLFRQTRQREAKTELVILLRPIVVDDAAIWDDMTRDYQEQIRGMQRRR
jgi:MSHA biogenesis protein MshL